MSEPGRPAVDTPLPRGGGEYAGPPPTPRPLGAEPLRDAPPANGHAPSPGPPGGAWIVVGPRTRAHAARVLEQQLAPVWVALLETSGVAEGQGWRLVVDGCHLEPEPVKG